MRTARALVHIFFICASFKVCKGNPDDSKPRQPLCRRNGAAHRRSMRPRWDEVGRRIGLVTVTDTAGEPPREKEFRRVANRANGARHRACSVDRREAVTPW